MNKPKMSRVEHYLAYLIGELPSYPPKPLSRVEWYLDYLCKNGGGGGGGVIKPVNEDGTMTLSEFNALENGLYYVKMPIQRAHGDISIHGLTGKTGDYVNGYDYGHFFSDFNGSEYADYGSIDGFGLDEASPVIAELEAKIAELELFKFPNLTIHGTPTINHGQVSGFTVNDYLQFPFLVDFQNRAFTINMCFTTGTDVVNQQNIIDSAFGLAFAVQNSHFVLALSSNGTSWDLGANVGTYSVQPETVYYVRISWNRLIYKVEYSLDGRNYTLDISKTAAVQPYPRNIMVGVGDMHTDHPHAFGGVINLNYANLYIENELVWQGMDDVGLATRASVSLDNLDEDGREVVRSLAPVQDVQTNNESIVQDGVARIPRATYARYGLSPMPYGYAGIVVDSSGDTLVRVHLLSPSNDKVTSRNPYYAITPSVLDYAVKSAMCTNIGPAWTAAEQVASRERQGIVCLTKEAYDLLDVKGESTLYFILEGDSNA